MSVDKSLKIRLDDFNVQEIAERVFKINEFNLTTMFVIVGTERALVIDCGTGVGDFKSLIESITTLPYDVVATHAHCDHIGGRGQFEKIFISEKDVPIVKDVTVFFRKFYIWIMRYLMGFKVIRFRDAVIKKVEKEPQYVFVKENDTFDLGDKKLRIIETPGHTLGSISLLDETDRILFSGDNVNPNCLMFLKHASSIKTLCSTLKKIKATDGYDTIWASHLSAPVDSQTFDNGIACAEKISAKRNFLPLILFGNFNKYVIIHLGSKRR